MAKGDCTKCGICTAVCQSRVRVHEEVIEFGRVINPSCLKDLDCVAACPEGALGYGFGMPAVLERSKSSRLRSKPYDFTRREDLLIAAIFVVSLAVFRGLYQTIPFLLSLAIGGILGYVAVLSQRLLHLNHVKINNFQLKIGGGLTRAGFVFVLFAVIAAGFTAHSAFIRYHEFQGGRLLQLAHVGDERVDDAAEIAAVQSLGHLEFCNDWGFTRPPGLSHQLATLHAAIGQRLANQNKLPAAIDHLEKSCLFEPDVSTVRYNLGVLLATTGRTSDAIAQYERSIAIDPTDPDVHNNLGFVLLDRGDLAIASEHFRRAIALKPEFAHPHFNLGRILQAQGLMADASHEFELAIQLDPGYREFLTHSSPEHSAAAPNRNTDTPSKVSP